MVTSIIKIIAVSFAILNLIPILIWWERKGAAYIQDRRGPNRAQIFGVRLGGFVHNIADVIKLFFKEDIVPNRAQKFLYFLAPMIVMAVVLMMAAIIPFSAPIKFGDVIFKSQIADINVGIIYILAVSSMSVFGILFAGWSSSGSYSLYGGIRAASQLISYEVAMGLSLLSIVIFTGSVRLDEMIAIQGTNITDWNFVRQPVVFIIFLTCLFAESNRNPFDLPEAESELVAGYHTEYSSMKFALFFMAEYAHIIVGSLILVSIFFGGWQIPFLSTETLNEHLLFILKLFLVLGSMILAGAGLFLTRRSKKFGWGDLRDYEPSVFGYPMAIMGTLVIVLAPTGILNFIPKNFYPIIAGFLQAIVLFIKALIVCWLFIWVRWTLPRFRFDQLTKFGWKILVPLALANIVVTVILIGR